MSEFEPIESNPVPAADSARDTQGLAFDRDPETQGRPWITPGMPDLMHRLGGIEKDIDTGHISYDPENHQRMTDMRAAKIESVAEFIPQQTMELGQDEGELLVIGWGSTYGPIYQAVRKIRESHANVSYTHLRHLSPMPKNLRTLIARFNQVLVPEMNMGQLSTLLRDKLGADPVPFSKVTGQPFMISELVARCRSMLPPAMVTATVPAKKGKAQ
jgi:2-oxoglutarate ferredoxin oxidoreductase subunit alpha